MSQTKCLILDFDNCIALNEKTGKGSEEIKDVAWYPVFPEYGREELDAAMKAARENLASFAAGQADRQDLVREVCRYFSIPDEQIKDEVVRRCEAFNQIVQKGIAEIGVSEKAREALTRLAKTMPIYVNTATPTDAVIQSLEALGFIPIITRAHVYGRPGTKKSNLQSIIEIEDVRAEEVLFVDDQPTGWAIAQELGCRFVGIYTARNKAWHETPQPFPIISSLSKLVSFVS